MGIYGNKIKWQIPSDKVLIFYYMSKEDQTNQLLSNLAIKKTQSDYWPQTLECHILIWFAPGFFPSSLFSPSEVKFISYTELIITPISWLRKDAATFAQQKTSIVTENEKLFTVLSDSRSLEFIGSL